MHFNIINNAKIFIRLIVRNLAKVYWLFPVKQNYIILNSFYGEQYSCNTKYITQYLLHHYREHLHIIWVFNTPYKYNMLSNNGITLIKNKSFKYLYYILTSKFVITNDSWDYFLCLPFRKSQYLVETWHGGGAYKKVATDMPQISDYEKYLLQTFYGGRLTWFLSSSSAFTKFVISGAYCFNGRVLEYGMPRNDILLNDHKDIISKVYSYYDIPNDTKIILYAPTFRQKTGTSNYHIDFKRITDIFYAKHNSKCCIFIRMHYCNVRQDKILSTTDFNNVYDVSEYPDMQELLCAADVLITDYSSCMWDFSLMYKPCFIYATDIASYKQERDFYTPMSEWPFPIATNNDELINNIINFDEADYRKKVKKHHDDLGSCETGHASQIVGDMIYNTCMGRDKESIGTR